MTQKISLLTLSLLAAGALEPERFVTVGGVYATAAGNADGVSCTKAASGERFPADALGTSIVTAGGAFDKGDYLQVGANGKAVELASGIPVAKALQASTGDGARVEVLLIQNAPAPA